MSIKEFILSLFWKIFLLGVEFYTDFFFPFQNFKHTAQFYSQSPYFWKQSAVIFMLLHLYAMYLFSLATLKLYYFHWFWATWLWCAFVPFFFFFSCFLCLRFCWASWICGLNFIKFGNFWTTILQIFSFSPSLSTVLGNSISTDMWLLQVFLQLPPMVLNFLVLFLCVLISDISISLSSRRIFLQC